MFFVGPEPKENTKKSIRTDMCDWIIGGLRVILQVVGYQVVQGYYYTWSIG